MSDEISEKLSINLIYDNIALMETDAIVNAANTELKRGSGVCGAIFKAAGRRELQSACDKLAPIRTGEAVITPGFRLKAKYIIHTAGPRYQGGTNNEESLLRECYVNSLKLAKQNGCKSIAFPIISAGHYGYPPQEAFDTAVSAIQGFLGDSNADISVYLSLYGFNTKTMARKIFLALDDLCTRKFIFKKNGGAL
ncbi:RNase III inhibitor [Clostridia bacterium]|nr:RNase III inhibitor [Clostridia bacterium]